jgi:hypothetical protein
MKLIARPAILVLLVVLAACSTPGEVQTENVKDTVTTVTNRTQLYVEADEDLTADEKIERISRVASVRTYFSTGEEFVQIRPIYPDVVLTLDWHDAYIDADEALQKFERDLAKFESKALKGMADEAMRLHRQDE